MEREKFGSRLGFILISAGCAIGLGNVWRFPYIVGKYGGAAFVLIYLAFLLILGLPVMVAEFAVGRASQKSAACSFDVLEPKGTKWHLYKYGAIAGNYLLMMFYTTIAGWMILYFVKMATGQFDGLNSDQVGEAFSHMLGQPVLMTVFYGDRCFALLRHLRKRSSERCGAYHKSDDGMSALPDGRSGSSFGPASGRTGRTEVLSVSRFRKSKRSRDR